MTGIVRPLAGAAIALALCLSPDKSSAQVPPTEAEVAAYSGLHAAAARGDPVAVAVASAAGADLNGRDKSGRTPLHVAVYRRQPALALALLKAGADANALEHRRYDAVTIAAVANDLDMLRLLLANGASARNVTSPYDGTALIAAAHLGHVAVVKALTEARAPLDHVNNLGWTALMEAVVLGDGGRNHTETVRVLVEAGAKLDIPDRQGVTPLGHAERRGYAEIASVLRAAGARP